MIVSEVRPVSSGMNEVHAFATIPIALKFDLATSVHHIHDHQTADLDSAQPYAA